MMDKVRQLKADKLRLQELQIRLLHNDVLSPDDLKVFNSVVSTIEGAIENLQYELNLDETLQSDLPLDEFMKKFQD